MDDRRRTTPDHNSALEPSAQVHLKILGNRGTENARGEDSKSHSTYSILMLNLLYPLYRGFVYTYFKRQKMSKRCV